MKNGRKVCQTLIIWMLMLRTVQLAYRSPIGTEYDDGQYIVLLKPTVSDIAGAAAYLRQQACSETAKIGFVYERCLRGFSIGGVCDRSLARLRSNESVESVWIDGTIAVAPSSEAMFELITTTEPNITGAAASRPAGTGNVPSWLPWSIKRIGAYIAGTAANSTGGIGTNNNGRSIDADLFIIDTGIQPDHPDLTVGNLGAGFIPGSPGTDDENGHGTHVAGIAAARDNAYGCIGVCPGARVHPVRVIKADGTGQFSSVIAGVEYVQSVRSRLPDLRMVANISLGVTTATATYNVLDMAVTRAISAGITFVIAAGNNGADARFCSPAHVATAISVAAMDEAGQKAGFSNYGGTISLFAPGTDILSTYIGSRCAYRSGTSMAAPFVAGAAAYYLSKFPTARPAAVKAALVSASKATTAPVGGLAGYSARCLWMPPLFD